MSERAQKNLATIQSEARLQLIRKIESISVIVTKMSMSMLMTRAIRAHNEWDFGRSVTKKDDPELLEKIAVNYIADELTEYDEVGAKALTRAGGLGAERLIWKTIYQHIQTRYPELSRECERRIELKITKKAN